MLRALVLELIFAFALALALDEPSHADTVWLYGGNVIHGKVVSLNEKEIVLINKPLGRVTIPHLWIYEIKIGGEDEPPDSPWPR